MEITQGQESSCKPDFACRVLLGPPPWQTLLERTHSLPCLLVGIMNTVKLLIHPGNTSKKSYLQNVSVFVKTSISLCTSLWLCLRILAVLKYRKATRVSLKNVIHSFLAGFSIAPVLSIYTSSHADFIKAAHWIMNVPVQAQVYKKVLTHQDVPKMINAVKSFPFFLIEL